MFGTVYSSLAPVEGGMLTYDAMQEEMSKVLF